MPRVVVLPHPFGPTRLATIPGSTVRESSLTTVLSPYRFVTPLIRSPLKGGSPFRSRLWSARCRTNQRRRFPLLLVALDYEMYFGTRYDGLEETATDGDRGRLGAVLSAEL